MPIHPAIWPNRRRPDTESRPFRVLPTWRSPFSPCLRNGLRQLIEAHPRDTILVGFASVPNGIRRAARLGLRRCHGCFETRPQGRSSACGKLLMILRKSLILTSEGGIGERRGV